MGTQEEILKELKEQVEQNKKALENSKELKELEKKSFHQSKKQTGLLKKIGMSIGGAGVTASAIAVPIELATKGKDTNHSSDKTEELWKVIQKINKGQVPSNVELRKLYDDLLVKITDLRIGQSPSNKELGKKIEKINLDIKGILKDIERINENIDKNKDGVK